MPRMDEPWNLATSPGGGGSFLNRKSSSCPSSYISTSDRLTAQTTGPLATMAALFLHGPMGSLPRTGTQHAALIPANAGVVRA